MTEAMLLLSRIREEEQEQVDQPIQYSGNARHALREHERRNRRW